MERYVRMFMDPFDPSIEQPKFFDGQIDRTAGLRLKSTGSLTCHTSDYTYIAVLPGASNALAFNTLGTLETQIFNLNKTPDVYKGFRENLVANQQIKQSRLLAVGAKFHVVNAMDALDGTWEAVRYQLPAYDQSEPVDSRNRRVQKIHFMDACEDMINDSTYQSGRLRDLHKYMFRLNYRTNGLKFVPHMDLTQFDQLDCIVIRIRGRQVANEPTMITYESAALHEIEYDRKTATALARLHSRNTVIPNIDELLNKMNWKQCAMRISN